MADVVLIDGSTVSSDSEAWRHECEARHLLDAMSLGPRRAYLAAIKAKRGDAAYARLADTITAIWKARREARGASG